MERDLDLTEAKTRHDFRADWSRVSDSRARFNSRRAIERCHRTVIPLMPSSDAIAGGLFPSSSHMITMARRLKREMSGGWFWALLFRLYPKKLQEKFRSMSQIILLERR